eukprot:36106-Prymnesium_polylepis.1
MASGTTMRGSWSGTSRRKPSPSSAWTASKIVSTFFEPEMQRTTPDVGVERRLDWADFQPAM